MLRLRVFTAIVLVAMMIAATLWLTTPMLGAFIGVFMLIGAWEWTALAGLSGIAPRAAFLALVAVTGLAAYSAVQARPAIVTLLMAAAAVWWVWALFDLLRHADTRSGLFGGRARTLFAGLMVLVPAWLALLLLHDRNTGGPAGGPGLAIYLLALVWAADTGAYFAGRQFGRHKLAPAISPGKTLEGVSGGMLAVAGFTLIVAMFVWKVDSRALILWLAIACVAALFSVLGDLTESRLKRAAGVKDSGTIFPGHGGVLDRIDAYTAAAPVFVLGWMWLRPV